MNSIDKLPVTTIIPSYNHEKYLGEAIESVLGQSKVPSEIIVVDDFSNDNSRKILEKYLNQIRVIHHKQNMGGAETLNTGIKSASEDFIAILNSDDTWELDKLEKQFSYLNENNLDVCFTQANIIDVDSRIVMKPPRFLSVFELTEPVGDSFLNHFFYRGNFLCHSSMLARKEMYTKFGFYQGGLEQLPDFAKWIDFAKNSQLGILPEKLVNCRYLHGQNASSQKVIESQIRTNNELYLIFSTFFDELSIDQVKELFKLELSSLTGIYKEMADFDPGTALLLTHPKISLADQALHAGIFRIWNYTNTLQVSQKILLRRSLGKIEITIRNDGLMVPSKFTQILFNFKRLMKKGLLRLTNVK